MHATFSIEEALKFGWHKTRQHSTILFQVLLTLFALNVVQAMVSSVLRHQLIGVLALIAIAITEFLVGVGLTLMTLKIAKGEHVKYVDIIPPVQTAWHYFLAAVLVGLFVVLGLIVLILPGIYLALRFSMVRFRILEKPDVMGSLTYSGELTAGIKWKLLGFFIVLVLLNILGAILLMVGLLVTVPVTMIAYAHVYQKLSAHYHSHHSTA